MKDVLIGAADAVSRAVSSFGGDAGAIAGTGAYGTPTQAIDKVAEEAVLRYLDDKSVDCNVLSEEAGFLERGGSRTLVLDPVDGTYNAVRGIPFYATSMAVGTKSLSDVTHALVRDLPNGETFYAEKGAGASRNGRRIHARRFRRADSLASVYLGEMAESESYDVAKSARRVRSLGAASLDLSHVASGGLDFYYMNTKAAARLRIMDIAAGVLLVREAGGVVTDPAGADLDLPLALEARTNLVAAGDPTALEALR